MSRDTALASRLREVATRIRAEGTTMQRRPRARLEAYADEVLAVAATLDPRGPAAEHDGPFAPDLLALDTMRDVRRRE